MAVTIELQDKNGVSRVRAECKDGTWHVERKNGVTEELAKMLEAQFTSVSEAPFVHHGAEPDHDMASAIALRNHYQQTNPAMTVKIVESGPAPEWVEGRIY